MSGNRNLFNNYPDRTDMSEDDIALLWNTDTNSVNNFKIGTLIKLMLSIVHGKITVQDETLKIE